MKESKIKQAETREVRRSEIRFAPYNPRKISEEARKKLKKNLKRIGLLGGIVWNERTGNLVSGHQKMKIIDEVNRYDQNNIETDYIIRVEVVDLDEKEEKVQNLFMNNREAQGEYDDEAVKDILSGLDAESILDTGYSDFTLQIMGFGEDEDFSPVSADAWTQEETIQDDEKLKRVAEETKESGENTKIDRSVDFYEDTPENQIARHNEVQKIKDRIQSKANSKNDGVSYVMLSFFNVEEKERFCEDFGYSPNEVWINGAEFIEKLEFGE